jgi:hypothetical protein
LFVKREVIQVVEKGRRKGDGDKTEIKSMVGKRGKEGKVRGGEGKTRNENKKEVIFPERRNLHAR